MVFGQTNTGFNSNGFGNAGVQQSAAPAASLASLGSLIQGGGAKAFFTADSKPGDMVEGEIVSVEVSQMRDFQTKMPATWQDGQAKQQIHIVLQTSLPPEDDEDDGRRSLWIKGWGVQLKALREACRQAGVKEPSKGDVFAARYAGLGERGNAPQPPKMYEYRVIPQSQAAVSGLLNEPAPQQAMPVQAQAQQAPVQQSAPAVSQQPVQQASAISASQVQSLLNMGKTMEEVAGFLGVTAAQVEAVLPPTMGQDGNPVF
ncbi:hypothetical protein DD097_16285 [Clostridioides difficile]|nr:hypothetical protein [Clostridioides difficile]